MRVLIIVAASLFVPLTQSASADPLGEHPAVMIKRHAGTQSPQPAYMNFYRHPAHLDLLTQAPEDETVATQGDMARPKIAVAPSHRTGPSSETY